jgi:hypothetical protein
MKIRFFLFCPTWKTGKCRNITGERRHEWHEANKKRSIFKDFLQEHASQVAHQTSVWMDLVGIFMYSTPTFSIIYLLLCGDVKACWFFSRLLVGGLSHQNVISRLGLLKFFEVFWWPQFIGWSVASGGLFGGWMSICGWLKLKNENSNFGLFLMRNQ